MLVQAQVIPDSLRNDQILLSMFAGQTLRNPLTHLGLAVSERTEVKPVPSLSPCHGLLPQGLPSQVTTFVDLFGSPK